MKKFVFLFATASLAIAFGCSLLLTVIIHEGNAGEAATQSPLKSSLWLSLGRFEASKNLPGANQALEMAYLTGGGKHEELIARLNLAFALPLPPADMLQHFLQTDVTLSLQRLPEARELFLSAFRNPTSANQAAILTMIEAADSAFANEVRVRLKIPRPL